MPLARGTVGPDVLSDGVVAPGGYRQGKSGEVITSLLHGRYYEQAVRGNMFLARAVITAPVIFTTAAGTGGPLLWNGTSNKNAVLLSVGIGVTVVTTVAAALGITGNNGQTSAPGSTTAIDSVSNCFIGGALPGCNVYRVGTPTNAGSFLFPLTDLHTGALTVDTTGGWGWFDIGGSIIVPPGCWASVASSATASTTVAQIGLMWEEVPV